MSLIQRFLLGNRVDDDLQVGLFLKNDGTVWLRNPDGSETELPGAGGSSVTISDTDPGAIGAGSQWLRTDPGIPGGAGTYRQLYVRNSANDGWIQVGLVHYDADGNRRMAVTTSDVATDITVWDALGVMQAILSLGPEKVTIGSVNGPIDLDILNGGHATLVTDTRGTTWSLHSGAVDAAEVNFNFLYGSFDPSADDGLVAAPGALYSRAFTDGTPAELWFKTNVLDTDWQKVIFA